MSKMASPFTTGYWFGKAMLCKLGGHEGSEGHPINFERTGEFHKMKNQFPAESQGKFVDGYRQAWDHKDAEWGELPENPYGTTR